METLLILFLTTAGPAVIFVGFAFWRGEVLARGRPAEQWQHRENAPGAV